MTHSRPSNPAAAIEAALCRGGGDSDPASPDSVSRVESSGTPSVYEVLIGEVTLADAAQPTEQSPNLGRSWRPERVIRDVRIAGAGKWAESVARQRQKPSG
jgi:hypothetical protein